MFVFGTLFIPNLVIAAISLFQVFLLTIIILDCVLFGKLGRVEPLTRFFNLLAYGLVIGLVAEGAALRISQALIMECVAACERAQIRPQSQAVHTDTADGARIGLSTLETHCWLDHKAPAHLVCIAQEHIESLACHQIALRTLHLEVDRAKLHFLLGQHL